MHNFVQGLTLRRVSQPQQRNTRKAKENCSLRMRRAGKLCWLVKVPRHVVDAEVGSACKHAVGL